MSRRDNNILRILEKKRLEYAKAKIVGIGHAIEYESENEIRFLFKGKPVSFFPYTGWHTGSTIKDGRGLENLLKQIKL
jgi:hypothetical protein